MALAVRYPRVEFDSVRGPQSHQGETTFTREVNHAGVALTGFHWDYDSSDHHINIAEATTRMIGWDGNTVQWEVELDYRDKNGDDRYTCAVDVTVFADLQ
jgi:hypothetical protein